MKKLLFSLVFVTNVSFSQECSYSMINESQNKLLDRYGIMYTGPYIRYMVTSGNVNNLGSKELISQFNKAFKQFSEWNNSFDVVPEPGPGTISFKTYFSDKKHTDFKIKMISGRPDKILKIKSVTVNDSVHDIKTIDIIEYYNESLNSIEHEIFYSNFSGIWNVLYYDDTDTELSCPPCVIP